MSRRLELAERLLGQPLHDYQKRLLTSKAKKRLVLKSRQTGISTILAIEAILDCIQNDNYTVLLLSKDERASVELLKKIKIFIRRVPGWEQLVGGKDRQDELELSTGSRLLSLTSNPDNARGYTADHIIFDEFASFKEIEEVWSAALPTISLGGRITIASTPKGKKNRFYGLWIESNDWEKYELPWEDCPHLLEENISLIQSELQHTPGLFEQEYCCSFDVVAGSLFNYSELEALEIEETSREGQVIVGYDPAAVLDKSVVLVLQKRKEKKTVLHIEELSNLPYPEQGQRVIQIAESFRASKVVIDAGGVGSAVYDHLKPIHNRVVKFNFTQKRKVELAILIKSDASKHNLEFVKNKYNPNLFQEMCMFDTANTNFKRKEGSHSDYFAALLLAYSEARGIQPFRQLQLNIRNYKPSLSDAGKKWNTGYQ